jgi:hypothetical protein
MHVHDRTLERVRKRHADAHGNSIASGLHGNATRLDADLHSGTTAAATTYINNAW